MTDDFQRQYRLRFSERSEYRDRVWKVLIREFFQTYVPRDGTVLDLGCGWGEFINNVEARTKYAMDLNGDAASKLAPTIRFFQQDCSKTWPLDNHSLDVVFSSNFLEHLPSKPMLCDTMIEVRRCLKPAGRLICLGPNIRCVHGAYWDFWDHHIPLTERSLSELMRLVGFRVATEKARFLPYTMSRGRSVPTSLVKVYVRLPFLWPIFGRQFFVVAEKGET